MLTNEVARRLEQKLGLGQFPLVRRRLFSRIQRVCEQKGEAPLMIVAAVLEEALGPKIRDKGHYFSFVVVRRLTEQGYWTPAEAPVNQTRHQAQSDPNPTGGGHAVLTAARGSIGKPAEDPSDLARAAEIERLKLANELLLSQLREARSAAAFPDTATNLQKALVDADKRKRDEVIQRLREDAAKRERKGGAGE